MRDIVVRETLVDDLCRRLRCDDIYSWLESQAEQLAALGTDGTTGQTRLTRELFRARSVSSVERRDTLTQQACIAPAERGYKIQYAANLPPTRRRFALAHELGHTYLFREHGSVAPLSSLQGAEDQTIEALCDFFARTLLLPRSRFVAAIEHVSRTGRDAAPLHMVPQLAREFGVAEQAVARRMVFDLFPGQETVLCVKCIQSGSEYSWRTVWCASAAAIVADIPTGWRIALDSNGRRIPEDLIPQVPEGTTNRIEIDGRWHAAACPQAPSDSAQPLAARRALPTRPALVARYEREKDLFGENASRLFIAI